MDYLIAAAVTADILFAAMACGMADIQIPFLSRMCIAIISSGLLVASAAGKCMLLGALPHTAVRWIGFISLTAIGLIQMFGSRISLAIRNAGHTLPALLRIGAAVFLDHTQADRDQSHILSVPEAVILALPLSIDSLLCGLGIAAQGFGLLLLLAAALAWNLFIITCGCKIGKWVPIPNDTLRAAACGTVLIVLGLCRLLC